jgi:hypothetical protein
MGDFLQFCGVLDVLKCKFKSHKGYFVVFEVVEIFGFVEFFEFVRFFGCVECF